MAVFVEAAEVARARERDVHELIEEFVHALAAERYLVADDIAFAELEGSDGLLRDARCWLLAGDLRELLLDERVAALSFALPTPEETTIFTSFGEAMTFG
jgi:hypothetical protein